MLSEPPQERVSGRYCARTDQFSSLPPLTYARELAGAAQLADGAILVAGGKPRSGPTGWPSDPRYSERIDLRHGEWIASAELNPLDRFPTVGTTVLALPNGNAVAIDVGYEDAWTAQLQCRMYDRARDRWTMALSQPFGPDAVPIDLIAVALDDSSVVIASAPIFRRLPSPSALVTTIVHRWHTTTGAWQIIRPPQSGGTRNPDNSLNRAFSAPRNLERLADGSLLYRQNRVTDHLITTLERYFPASNTWVSALPDPSVASPETLGEVIAVNDGRQAVLLATNQTLVLDVASGAWRAGPALPGYTLPGWGLPATRLLALPTSGLVAFLPDTSVFRFDPTALVWQAEPSATNVTPSELQATAPKLFGDNAVFLKGQLYRDNAPGVMFQADVDLPSEATAGQPTAIRAAITGTPSPVTGIAISVEHLPFGAFLPVTGPHPHVVPVTFPMPGANRTVSVRLRAANGAEGVMTLGAVTVGNAPATTLAPLVGRHQRW